MDWSGILLTLSIVALILYMIYLKKTEWKEFKLKEEKYNVNKFPVTSIMGNKYFAEIVYKKGRFGSWIECNIYDRIFKNEVRYKDEMIETKHIDFESFDYNFKNVVVQIINDYEYKHKTEIKKRKHMEEALVNNKRSFNEWDGIIKQDSEP